MKYLFFLLIVFVGFSQISYGQNLSPMTKTNIQDIRGIRVQMNKSSLLNNGGNSQNKTTSTNTGSIMPLYDSAYIWEWASGKWKISPSYKHIILYDANKNKSIETFLAINGTVGSIDSKSIYTYDAQNNLKSSIYQEWNKGAWVNVFSDLYSYDVSNRIISDINQDWDGTSWKNSLKTTYTYNINNKEATQVIQNWDNQLSLWVNLYRYSSSYNTTNNLTTLLLEIWNINKWSNYDRDTYTYDGNNNLTYDLYEGWDGFATWVNKRRIDFTYNSMNDLVTRHIDDWAYQMNWHWEFSGLYDYSYTFTANNIIRTEATRAFNNSLRQYVTSGDSVLYMFNGSNVGLNNVSKKSTTACIFPNPCNARTKISFSEEVINGHISIYNELGIEVNSFNFKGMDLDLETKNMTHGIYFIEINECNKTTTKLKLLIN